MPQRQASLRTLNEQTTQRGGNVRLERLEQKFENAFRHNIRRSSRDEPLIDPNFPEDQEKAHYNFRDSTFFSR